MIRHTRKRLLALVLLAVFFGLTGFIDARAQTPRVQIKIRSSAPARVGVELELPAATSALSFRNTYAGVLGLGERIEHLEASVDDRKTPVRTVAPGEYKTELAVNRLRYEVNLSGPLQPSQRSHVSSLNGDHGLLMLADLLPRVLIDLVNSETSIELEVPSGWAIAANISGENRAYSTKDVENTVFLVGPSVRKKTRRIGGTNFSIVTAGRWPFSDGDAFKVAERLIKEYSEVTGETLRNDAFLMLLPFGRTVGPERWTAETRGNAIVLLLGSEASRKRVLAKLGIVLSHEAFHLWVPNALALEGDYDWFFEGFTLYQALRVAQRFKLISFDTYLETIARVYDSYLSATDRDRLSLIEASERRWTTAASLVYDKGMLAAFVYDLTVRSASDCQRSLDDVYRQLFRRPGTGQGSANETIIRILNEATNMSSFGRDYVEGKGRIDLQPTLSSFGLQLRSSGQKTRLEVENDLTQPQRKALRCLGYRG